MASSSTIHVSFLFLSIFLITILSSSHNIHARDSQFFSKITNPNTNTIPNQNEIKPTNKQDLLPLKNNEQDVPNFIPQSQDSGYGLYGHESGQLPPSATTTTTVPGDGNQEKQGMSDTRFVEKSYTTPINSYEPEKQNEGNNLYYDENNAYNQEKQVMRDTRNMEKENYYTTPVNSYEPETENGGKMYNQENNMYNQEKQGMSDTRFMEKSYTTPIYSYDPENGGKMFNQEKQNEVNNFYNQENNMYNQENQEMGGTRFMEKGYTTPINGEKMYNQEKQNEVPGFYNGENNMYNQENQEMSNGKMYNQEKQGMSDTRFMKKSFEYNNGGQMYNSEKQGMSDTRFLENGKYYYDLNNENYNYNSLNSNDDSRGAEWKYEYTNKGNYGNNGNSMEFQNEDDLP